MQRKRSRGRIFSYEEALSTFPVIRDLTAAAVRQVEAVVNAAGEGAKPEVEEACDRIFQAWAREVTSFGCEVKGCWLVDWDSGDGYYCWRFPEQTVAHFHTYEDGFEGRMPIN